MDGEVMEAFIVDGCGVGGGEGVREGGCEAED